MPVPLDWVEMCGIAGIMRFTPGETAPPLLPVEWIRTLDESVKHRGPDGHGVLVDRVFRRAVAGTDEVAGTAAGWLDVALIHRRLSIIDIEGGAQPMVDPPVVGGLRGEAELTPLADDALAVVFNGCIYNHRELRAELIAGGAKFQTDHSDTEVLLHGYRAWGERMPERLEGMFAFVIWDRARGILLHGRDRAGEKPLFSSGMSSRDADPTFVFASTSGGLIRWRQQFDAGFDASILHMSTPEWVEYGSYEHPVFDSPRTIAPGVGGLRIYHAVLARGFGSRFQRPATRDRNRTAPAFIDELVGKAVAERLEADVPLGCLLSGGVDSSIVAAHASRLSPGLRTFCVRMPDSRYDESEWAQAVADALGTKHTTLECEARPLEDLELLIGNIGKPFGDSSLLPTYWLCEAVRRDVKVALSGDGGDELFGGYERQRAALQFGGIWPALECLPAGLFEHTHPRSKWNKLARLIRAAQGTGYSDLVAIFPHEMRWQLWGEPRPSRGEMEEWRAGKGGRDWPVDPLRVDFDVGLREDLLRKVDAASMAVGLEVRAPLLSRDLVEAAFRTPLDILMPPTAFGGRRLKGLLKDALRLHLPDRLIDRPKAGFAIPIGEWFRSDYGGLGTAIRDVLASVDPWPSVTAACPLNLGFCRRILEEHMSGRRDHGQRLYALLVLHIWDRWLRRVGGLADGAGMAGSSAQNA